MKNEISLTSKEVGTRVIIEAVYKDGTRELLADDPNYKVKFFRDAVAKCLTGTHSISYIKVGDDNSVPASPADVNSSDLESPYANTIIAPATATFSYGFLDGRSLTYGTGFRSVSSSGNSDTTNSEAIFNFTWNSGSDVNSGYNLDFGEFGLFAADSSDSDDIMLARFVLTSPVTKTDAFALSITWRYFIKWN